MSEDGQPDTGRLAYLDFEIEIGKGIGGRDYQAAVLNSSAGQVRETMRFPYDELVLDNHLKDLQIALLRSGGPRRLSLSREEQAVQDFGSALFRALFVGEVRNLYDFSQMAALPWKFLYDARASEYVCLSRHTPIVRYLEIPQGILALADEMGKACRSMEAILVWRGLPATLAMLNSISDRAAIAFSCALYEAVAEGWSVDAAAEARKAVSLAIANTVEWGTQALHMRSPDGVLFKQVPQLRASVERQKPAEKSAVIKPQAAEKTDSRPAPARAWKGCPRSNCAKCLPGHSGWAAMIERTMRNSPRGQPAALPYQSLSTHQRAISRLYSGRGRQAGKILDASWLGMAQGEKRQRLAELWRRF